MQRSRLKNIINKSQALNIVKEPYDLFVESLPSELDYYKDGGKYRLKAAWEAYGKPKDYKEALWQGLVETIGGSFKMPSIRYNEETDEYEYLNTGKDNEIVNRDIRAWDNDVIPFIKELKLGGYIREFDEEKNCWKYQKGGKAPKKQKSNDGTSYYNKETDTIVYGGSDRKSRKEAIKYEYVHARPNEYEDLIEYLKPYYENLNDDRIQELGGDLSFVKQYENDPNHFYNPEELAARVVAAQYRTRNVPEYSEEFFTKLKENETKYGDNMRDLLHMYSPKVLSEIFSRFNNFGGSWGGGFSPDGTFVDPNGEIGDGQPLTPTGEYTEDGRELYADSNGDKYTLYKQGGQMNVIPEGALHARKNNMELAKEGGVTHKGIPVVDNEGNQQAEVEKEEWTMTKELTEDVENWYHKFYNEDTTQKEKDEIAIKCGKRICKELLHNTEDRAGLIEKLLENE